MKNFVPWVRPKASQHWDLEEEEKEEEEMIGLLDCYVARKSKRQESFEREPDADPDQAERAIQPATDGGSETQGNVIPESPETESSDRPALANVAMIELREAPLSPTAIQVVYPPDQAAGPLAWAKNT